MNEKVFPLLGFARKAGKLSVGHDAAVSAIVKNKARLCLVCADASERLKKEMTHACSFDGKEIAVVLTDCKMEELSRSIGTKAAVLTVDDEGFASRIQTLCNENI